MANIPVWWARTIITSTPGGVTSGFGPGGVTASGGARGPGSGFLSLGESSAALSILEQFWVFPGNVPADVCQVTSVPLATFSGELVGITGGGVFPFGPWPITTCDVILTQRVFSNGAPVATASLTFPVVSILGAEFRLVDSPMPSQLAFPPIQFDMASHPNVTIDASLIFHIQFLGEGGLSFSPFVTSPPFVFGVPQWNLV